MTNTYPKRQRVAATESVIYVFVGFLCGRSTINLVVSQRFQRNTVGDTESYIEVHQTTTALQVPTLCIIACNAEASNTGTGTGCQRIMLRGAKNVINCYKGHQKFFWHVKSHKYNIQSLLYQRPLRWQQEVLLFYMCQLWALHVVIKRQFFTFIFAVFLLNLSRLVR